LITPQARTLHRLRAADRALRGETLLTVSTAMNGLHASACFPLRDVRLPSVVPPWLGQKEIEE
jgi:hypothetical protein